MQKSIINLYGGPGTGKSTTAAEVFAKLKHKGVNCEYVQEYAKDRAWEHGDNFKTTPKVFKTQEYIFGKQSFRLKRLRDEVDVIVTDSPLLLGLIYTPDDYELPSLKNTIYEAYLNYNNFDVFLNRTKPYNPKGRLQTKDQAVILDNKIKEMLDSKNIKYQTVNADQSAADHVIKLWEEYNWLLNYNTK